MKIFNILKKHGLLAPLVKIALAIAAIPCVFYVANWMVSQSPAHEAKESPGWSASLIETDSTPYVPPPTGFPSMEFPPPLVGVGEGEPQPVPTRYGLTYVVPSGDMWRPTNGAIMGWSDENGRIGTYGAVSDYGYGYCEESDSAELAAVGITGRNAVDVDTAARDAIAQAERIYTGDEGQRPTVRIQGPFEVDVSGRPSVRYTALVTDIHMDGPCEPRSATFDIVATPSYSNAEVAIFMIDRATGVEDSLSDRDADEIIESLRRSE